MEESNDRRVIGSLMNDDGTTNSYKEISREREREKEREVGRGEKKRNNKRSCFFLPHR